MGVVIDRLHLISPSNGCRRGYYLPKAWHRLVDRFGQFWGLCTEYLVSWAARGTSFWRWSRR